MTNTTSPFWTCIDAFFGSFSLTFFYKSFPGSAQFRQLNRLFNQWEHFKLRSCLYQIGCEGRRSLSRPQESKPWTGWLQQYGSSTICLASSSIFHRAFAFEPVGCMTSLPSGDQSSNAVFTDAESARLVTLTVTVEHATDITSRSRSVVEIPVTKGIDLPPQIAANL